MVARDRGPSLRFSDYKRAVEAIQDNPYLDLIDSAILIAFLRYSNGDGIARPSLSTLARVSKVSRSTVADRLLALREADVLAWTPGGGRGKSNVYWVRLHEDLEEIAAEWKQSGGRTVSETVRGPDGFEKGSGGRTVSAENSPAGDENSPGAGLELDRELDIDPSVPSSSESTGTVRGPDPPELATTTTDPPGTSRRAGPDPRVREWLDALSGRSPSIREVVADVETRFDARDPPGSAGDLAREVVAALRALLPEDELAALDSDPELVPPVPADREKRRIA